MINQQGVLTFDKLVYITNIACITLFLRKNTLYCIHVKCKRCIFLPHYHGQSYLVTSFPPKGLKYEKGAMISNDQIKLTFGNYCA
jgi:hypothetical protein